MSMELPVGYTARAARRDDAAEVARLMTTCQQAEGGDEETTSDEVLSGWEGMDFTDGTVVVVAGDGAVAAYAEIFHRRFLQATVYGYVHPDHVGRGLGRYLAEWGEGWALDHMHRAPADAQVTVQRYIAESNVAARRLVESLGYSALRTTYVMSIGLEHEPEAVEMPEGFRIRPFVAGQDERVTFETIESAFRDTWGRTPGDYERWLKLTEGVRRDPDLWFLAERDQTGEVVGACIGRATDGRAWIYSLGVVREARRRGVALALLRHTFAACYRQGVGHLSLSVDAESHTQVPRAYARAGMQATKSYLLYRKELRAGVDLTVAPGET